MTLLRKIPKPPKRSTRWRSQAHLNHVRSFACVNCGSVKNITAAHVRFGSHCGMGQKPDDWRTAPLCDGPHANADNSLGCHDVQHKYGEQTFWDSFAIRTGATVEEVIAELIKTSPKRREIEAEMKERGL